MVAFVTSAYRMNGCVWSKKPIFSEFFRRFQITNTKTTRPIGKHWMCCNVLGRATRRLDCICRFTGRPTPVENVKILMTKGLMRYAGRYLVDFRLLTTATATASRNPKSVRIKRRVLWQSAPTMENTVFILPAYLV